jgi:hypothetical protein
MLPLGGLHGKHAVQRGILVPTQTVVVVGGQEISCKEFVQVVPRKET